MFRRMTGGRAVFNRDLRVARGDLGGIGERGTEAAYSATKASEAAWPVQADEKDSPFMGGRS